jgi:hypothetical protein
MKKKVAVTLVLLAGLFLARSLAQDWFFAAWVSWGLIFGVLEFYGLRDQDKGDTLSEQVWLGTLSKSKVWAIFWRIFVAVLLSWLLVHFLIGV